MRNSLLAISFVAMLSLGLISTAHPSLEATESKAYKGVITIALSGVIWQNDPLDRKHTLSGEINVDYSFSETTKEMVFLISKDTPSKIIIDSERFEIPADTEVKATPQSIAFEFDHYDYKISSKFLFPKSFPTFSEADSVNAIRPSKIVVTSTDEKFSTIPKFGKMVGQVHILKVETEISYQPNELRQNVLEEINADRANPGPKEECSDTARGDQLCRQIIEIPTIKMICDANQNCHTESDRSSGKTTPVQLSDNGAAQALAEDMLNARYLSFWQANGEKPYMTYTRYGGQGDVQTSIAWGYYSDESLEECKYWLAICPRIDPKDEVASLEHLLTYISVDGSWANRDNVLDKYHTDASIGIAYDDYHVVLVLNFENNYVNYDTGPSLDSRKQAHVGAGISGGKLDHVTIYKDPLPSPSDYLQHRDEPYDSGKMVAVVVEPAEPGYYYEQPTDYTLIEASTWDVNTHRVDIVFDMAHVAKRLGVYTITLWLEDDEGSLFPGSSYSFFVT